MVLWVNQTKYIDSRQKLHDEEVGSQIYLNYTWLFVAQLIWANFLGVSNIIQILYLSRLSSDSYSEKILYTWPEYKPQFICTVFSLNMSHNSVLTIHLLLKTIVKQLLSFSWLFKEQMKPHYSIWYVVYMWLTQTINNGVAFFLHGNGRTQKHIRGMGKHRKSEFRCIG